MSSEFAKKTLNKTLKIWLFLDFAQNSYDLEMIIKKWQKISNVNFLQLWFFKDFVLKLWWVFDLYSIQFVVITIKMKNKASLLTIYCDMNYLNDDSLSAILNMLLTECNFLKVFIWSCSNLKKEIQRSFQFM